MRTIAILALLCCVALVSATTHGAVIVDQLNSESLAAVQNSTEAVPLSTAPIVTVPAAVVDNDLDSSQLTNPLLPGTELLGMGIDLKQGLDLDSLRRPCMRLRKVETIVMPEGTGTKTYSVPTWQIARRLFKADMVTKVFDSLQESLMDLAASASLEFSSGMFSGSASAKVKITKDSSKKTLITTTTLDVQLLQLYSSKFQVDDLHRDIMTEFTALPQHWTQNPMAFQAFLSRWGTHVLKGAKVGGSFEMSGTTTTDKDQDNLNVAAALKLSFEGSLKISGQAEVDYKKKELMSKMQNNFDFHAKGGDPSVSGMLAQAQANGATSSMMEAFGVWLTSVKALPSVFGLKVDPIYKLFYVLPPSGATDGRILALKQAVDVYLRESVDPQTTTVLVRPDQVEFSNFWRLTDSCLTFQATIGPANTFNVYLTSSASRLNIGYRIDMDQFGSKIYKNEKMLIGSGEFGAITPGSSVLYSSYIVCFDSVKGNILFGRNGRVMFAYKDVNPSPALFFGFGTRGSQQPASVTAVRLMDLKDMTCPVFNTEFCGGSERGTCLETKMCKCSENYRGYACNYRCPMDVNGTKACSGNGQCALSDTTSEDGRPFCTCNSGYLGDACDINDIPSVTIRLSPLAAAPTDPSAAKEIRLISGVATSLGMLFEAPKNPKALDIEPASMTFFIQDADSEKPVVLTGKIATYTFVPGPATIVAKVTWPLNPDVSTTTINVVVNDCICSGMGECDASGKCKCDASALGDFCEDDVVTGVALVGASSPDTSHKFVYIPYSRKLGDAMKNIAFTPYQLSAGMSFSYSVISSTPKGVYVKVVRADKAAAWTDRVRVMYKVRGVRFVEPQAGALTVGPSGAVAPKSFAIRFPLPFNEAPFVSVEAVGLDSKLPDRFKFNVKRASANSVIVQAIRSDAGVSSFQTWTQALKVRWTARAYPAKDTIQQGVVPIGAKAQGPFEIKVAFDDLYRNTPQVRFNVLNAGKDEMFDVIMARSTPEFMVVRVTKMSTDGSSKAGWKSSLELEWKAYPDSYDLSSMPTFTEFPKQELSGLDVVDPIQMSSSSTSDDCAQVCLQNPECKSFSFSSSDASCAASVAPALCSLKGVPASEYATNLIKNPCINTMEITSTKQRFLNGRAFPVSYTQAQWTSTKCVDQTVLMGLSLVNSARGVQSSFSCVYPSFAFGKTATVAATSEMRRAPQPAAPSELTQGQSIRSGDMLKSENGVYSVQLQSDGNMVLYKDNTAMWGSKTNGKTGPSKLVMQSDGNLVLYGGTNGDQAWWSSGSTAATAVTCTDKTVCVAEHCDNSGWKQAFVPRDGLVLRAPRAGGSDFADSASYLTMPAGWKATLIGHNQLTQTVGPSSGFNFCSRAGFNDQVSQIVISRVAASGSTDAKAAAGPFRVTLQDDGNLVVYNGKDEAVWSSETCSTCLSKYMWKAPGFWYQGMINNVIVGLKNSRSFGWTFVARNGPSNIGEGVSPGDMFGDWISGLPGVPIQAVRYLPSGEPVYLFADSKYTKMVSDRGYGRYYQGTIAQFDGNRWNSYANADGHYRLHLHSGLKIVPANQLSWQAATDMAAAKGGRLLTHAECRAFINWHFWYNKDLWWPVSDGHNEWCSVGNVHHPGLPHHAPWGKPGWGLESGNHGHRDNFAIVTVGTTTHEQAVNQLIGKYGIFKRICPSCAPSHREIFYKRLTAVGSFSYYTNLFQQWKSVGNVLNQDFALYSTEADMHYDRNRWTFCNYFDSNIGDGDVGGGFPRDCGPNGFVGSQWNSGFRHWLHQETVFYAAAPPTDPNYFTEPAGGCITGTVTDIDGLPTHLCMNSNNDYWCTRGTDGWKQCPENKGKYDRLFAETETYKPKHNHMFSNHLDNAVVVPSRSDHYFEFDDKTVSSAGFDITFEAMAFNDVHLAFMCTQQQRTSQAWEVVFGGWANSRSVIRSGIHSSLDLAVASGAANKPNQFSTYAIKLETVNGAKFLAASYDGKEILRAQVTALGCSNMVVGKSSWNWPVVFKPFYPTPMRLQSKKLPMKATSAACPDQTIMVGAVANKVGTFDLECVSVANTVANSAPGKLVFNSCYPWKQEGTQGNTCPANTYPVALTMVDTPDCTERGTILECRPLKFA